ncbi:MAG: tyrosine-type recombinase/integrase [Alphaproteobacteria bacterium]
MKLTEAKCKATKAIKKPLKLADGGGMYLHVLPTGGKKWRLKYRFMGKEKLLTLGAYPLVGLKEARERRDEAKKLLDAGQDPSENRKLGKVEQKQDYENSFENLAREWHEQKIHTWKSKHAENILKRLEANIFPHIGHRPIKLISPPELLGAVRKVEERGNLDLAHRIMQTCSQVFKYAVATGRGERDITTDLQGSLKPAKSKNLPHLIEKELPAFLKKLEKYDTEYGGKPLTKHAFKLLILTFLRSGEIRKGKWEEIDWDKKQWKIPAERMKVKEPHIVPLSKQSLKILKEVKKMTGDCYGGFIFPSQNNPRNPLSENTFLRAIEVLGYKGKTVGHGFRSTASTILNEQGFNKDVVERQLAHAERDQVRAAYNYAQYLPERAKMMQWWGDYLDRVSR